VPRQCKSGSPTLTIELSTSGSLNQSSVRPVFVCSENLSCRTRGRSNLLRVSQRMRKA
jgi:hypothetical protein